MGLPFGSRSRPCSSLSHPSATPKFCFDNTHPLPQDRCRRDGRSSSTRRTGCPTISIRAQEKRSGSALPMRPPHLLLPLPRPLRPTRPLRPPRPPRPPRPRRRLCLPQCRLRCRQALRACRRDLHLRCRVCRLHRRQALRACHLPPLRCRLCRLRCRQALRACHLALHLACPLPHRRLCRQGRRGEPGVSRRQT